MKKTLAILAVLLLPVFLAQHLSLYQFGRMRAWLTSRMSHEILVGVEWPFEANQDGMDNGLQLAQDEINSQGGVQGKKIRLVMRDDHLDHDLSRSIAVDFAHDPRMMATIGFYDSRFGVRASAIFEESELLHIIAGAKNTYMTSHGFRYLIRSILPSNKIAHDLARMCVERGYKNYALIAEQGAFGEDLLYQFGTELDSLDAHVVYRNTYVSGTEDFHETVDDLKAANPDAIFIVGLENETANFIRTARQLGLSTPIVGSLNDTPKMHAIAGKALEGVMFYDLYDVNSPSPENRAFVAKYRRRFGKDPGTYAAQGYDALWILARAIQTTGSTNSLDVAYAIRYMNRWQGANGSYKFDSTGELDNKSIYLKVYRGGKPVVLATSHPENGPVSPVAR